MSLVECPIEQLNDNEELITAEWLELWAVKKRDIWCIPGSNFFLYRQRSSPVAGLWSLNRGEYEDLLQYGLYLSRGELRRVLAALEPDVEPVWNETDEECPDGNSI